MDIYYHHINLTPPIQFLFYFIVIRTFNMIPMLNKCSCVEYNIVNYRHNFVQQITRNFLYN